MAFSPNGNVRWPLLSVEYHDCSSQSPTKRSFIDKDVDGDGDDKAEAEASLLKLDIVLLSCL